MSRLALGLAAITLALTTVACDDDPEPRIAEPTTEATSEPSSEPPTTEPTSEPEPLSPVETVRAWIGGQNEALLRGFFGEVDGLSLPSCSICQDFLQPMRDIYSKGGRFETKPWRIAGIKAGGNGKSPRDVSVAIVIPGGITYSSSTSEPVRYKTEKRIMVFRVGSRRSGESGIATFEFLS